MFFISSSVPCSLLSRCSSFSCSAFVPSVCVFMLHVPVCIVAVSVCYPCQCLLSIFCLLCVICRFSCSSWRVFASQTVTTWCSGCVLCCVVSVGLCWCKTVFVCTVCRCKGRGHPCETSRLSSRWNLSLTVHSSSVMLHLLSR